MCGVQLESDKKNQFQSKGFCSFGVVKKQDCQESFLIHGTNYFNLTESM